MDGRSTSPISSRITAIEQPQFRKKTNEGVGGQNNGNTTKRKAGLASPDRAGEEKNKTMKTSRINTEDKKAAEGLLKGCWIPTRRFSSIDIPLVPNTFALEQLVSQIPSS